MLTTESWFKIPTTNYFCFHLFSAPHCSHKLNHAPILKSLSRILQRKPFSYKKGKEEKNFPVSSLGGNNQFIWKQFLIYTEGKNCSTLVMILQLCYRNWNTEAGFPRKFIKYIHCQFNISEKLLKTKVLFQSILCFPRFINILKMSLQLTCLKSFISNSTKAM